ncbi:MAG: hypothetical protein MJ198_04895 [Bacteroidales bacterium]|nr:hypothetical protein [Bacteroidales bacterium]
MNTDKRIENYERRLAVVKTAKSCGVSERFVNYLVKGERNVNTKKGALVIKEFYKNLK